MDLLNEADLIFVQKAFQDYKDITEKLGNPLPINSSPATFSTTDILIRELDCAVIEYLNDTLDEAPVEDSYDSVRGLFPEGNPLYSGAGFRIKDQIQICIRNPNCIKGYFLPRILDRGYTKV